MQTFLIFSAAAFAHIPATHLVTPDMDWCAVLSDVPSGDYVLLEPGDYYGPCDAVGAEIDKPGEVTVLQSSQPYDRARMHPGPEGYVIRASGQWLYFFTLDFSGLGPDEVGIDFQGGETFWVRYCDFTGLEGTAIRAAADVHRLIVSDNEFVGSGTAVSLGCPGGGCIVDDYEVMLNRMEGLEQGILANKGSWGYVGDNVITGGVRGAKLAAGAELTEVLGNLFGGSEQALELTGGGALTAVNNVVLGGLMVGATDDHQLIGNTLLAAPKGSALVVDGLGGSGNALVSNAVEGLLPDLPGGVEDGGNVGCPKPADCWVDAAGWDVFPQPGSLLRDAGAAHDELTGDWCSRSRGTPPTAGAFEGVGSLGPGPLEPLFKNAYDCTLEDEPTDTGTPGTTPTTPTTGTGSTPTDTGPGGTTVDTDDTEPELSDTACEDCPGGKNGGGGCGCAAPTGSGGAAWLVSLLWHARRR
jgi:hypothetical protein